jgi:Heterokaryon incompatibility protein (HET)
VLLVCLGFALCRRRRVNSGTFTSRNEDHFDQNTGFTHQQTKQVISANVILKVEDENETVRQANTLEKAFTTISSGPKVKEGVLNDAHVSILYSELGKTEIRVVEIVRGKKSAPIVCRIKQCSIEEVEYEALSYVWNQWPLGAKQAGENSEITVFGESQPGFKVPFGISWNLARALKYLRQEDRSRVMWIDQICTNQHKSQGPQELSIQMPRMPQIYGRATQVIAWVGELDELEPLFERANKRYTPAPLTGKEERALLKFANRFYWTRVWIIQEMVLARVEIIGMVGLHRLVFQCDSATMEYDALLPIIKIPDPWLHNHMDIYNIFPEIVKGSVRPALRTAIRPLQLLRRYRYWNSPQDGELPSLLHLVQWLRRWDSTEPVDRLFSMIQLVKTADFKVVDPSYLYPDEPETSADLSYWKQALADLVRAIEPDWAQPLSYNSENKPSRTSRLGLIKSYGAMIVSHAEGISGDKDEPEEHKSRLDGLNFHTGPVNLKGDWPSWIPDFGTKNIRFPLITSSTMVIHPFMNTELMKMAGYPLGKPIIYETATAVNPQIQWDGLRTLSVKGISIDTIKEYVNPFSPDIQKISSVEMAVSGIEDWAETAWTETCHWRSLTCYDEGGAPGFGGAMRRVAVAGYLFKDGGGTPSAEIFNTDGGILNPLQRMATRHPEAVIRAQLNRRIFRTEHGYIGVGPTNMGKDDSICLLYGGQTPYILRPASNVGGEKRWTLVGDCYVDQYMTGNFLKDWQASKEAQARFPETLFHLC